MVLDMVAMEVGMDLKEVLVLDSNHNRKREIGVLGRDLDLEIKEPHKEEVDLDCLVVWEVGGGEVEVSV